MNIFMVYENFDDYAWTGQSHNIEKSIISYHESEDGAKQKVAYLISNNKSNNVLIPETDDECGEVIYDYNVVELEE